MVVHVDRNMMLTPDEYMALMRLISSERESEGAKEEAKVADKPPKRSRAARAADRKLSSAFKEANRRYRKKDGSLRAGRTQADIARLAHKLRKRM
jgi:citrate lyase alpha subunit